MVGYHDSSMQILGDSLPVSISAQERLEIEQEVREFGAMVSTLQKDGRSPKTNYGATILPAYSLFTVLEALADVSPRMEEAFSVILDERTADRYGVVPRYSLSVPIVVSRGGYQVVDHYEVSSEEKRQLLASQNSYVSGFSKLLKSLENGNNGSVLENVL